MSRRRLFWLLQIGGWGAYGVSTWLAVLPDLDGGYARMAALKGVRTVVGFALSLAALPLLRRVRRQEPGPVVAGASALTTAVVAGPLWLWLYWTLTEPLRSPGFFPTDWSAFPRSSLDHAFVFLVWGSLYHLAGYWRDAEAGRRRNAEMRVRVREAELRMLRYQLNPHFLFNALSSLRASIPRGAAEARTIVERISSFLRYALDSSDRSDVSLAEELAAAADYLAIERVRFGSELHIRVHAAPDVRELRVPAFLLHPVVENAVKHGLASGAHPLHVEVKARHHHGMLEIEVSNTIGSWTAVDGAAAVPARARPGVGLENVRQRLARSFGETASLELLREDVRARVVLRMPGRMPAGPSDRLHSTGAPPPSHAEAAPPVP